VLVFGIRKELYVEDVPDAEVKQFVDEFREGRKSRWTVLGDTLLRYIPVNQLRKTPPAEEDE
jgi:hypothetical protein